jgi:hypothetical protein
MKKTNFPEAKTHLSKLPESLTTGKPVRKLGGWVGKVVIEKDFDVLPEEFIATFNASDNLI